MFVSFINIFTRIRKVTVSCQGLYAICCRLFWCKTCIVYWTVFDTTNWFCGCCFWVFCQWLFCSTNLPTPATEIFW